eukprot:GFUD01010610.1.p1 GENE.GFUD01010610.1~~GFUD01010610.1.p1  ORF type:complete len:1104 (+),score=472.03 GFUD01010610.1:138-3449(+)
MSDPAQSLFCGGVELQLDTLDQQEREEEEEEREEAARLDAQLAQKLEGAFDDLDFDDDDSSLCSPPGAIRNQDHGAMVTPGAGVQLKYLTSTPYSQGEQEMYGNMEVQQHHQPTTPYHNFQQLPVEETNFETPFVGRNYDAFGEDVRANHDRFGEDLNKSDSEKVLAKKLGVVTFKNDDVDILFKARGKEIDRLEKELSDRKSEFDCELRQIRHQLALSRAENQNQVGNSDQMQRVLSDARRENKIVTEEVHELNAKLKSLSMENEKLLAESEGSAAVVGQLQTQLTQLQSSDTVLKARQQHDATVRSLLERHKGEMSSLREEMDHANTRAIRLEQEKTVLHEKLSFAVAGQEMAVKARVEEVAELSSKLTTAIRNNQTGQLKEEIVRVKAELSVEQREREREMGERRRLEGEVEQLRVEIGALEALQGGHSDSMVQLGLSGAEGGVGGGSQRVREELHRSLVGNRTKRGEISRLESSLRSREGDLEQLRGREGELVRQVEQLGREVKLLRENMKESEENFTANKENVEELEMLKKEIEELEKQNIELKKHVSEIVEDNDTEKQEAIDELREEYEEQVKEAVEETKALMDGELKRLRIELEVYSKTLLEIRNNYTILGEENTGLLGKVKELKGQIEEKERKMKELKDVHVQDAQVEKSQTKIETLREDLKKDLEKEIYDKKEEELETARKQVKHAMDDQFDQKLLKVKKELREVWEMEAKLKAEEAVATARLDWIKRLPETEKKGGAARESLGELERVREFLVRERGLREKAEISTNERDIEIQRLVEREKELLRELGEGRREGMREAEERLGKEMRETLMKQQQQWEKIVRSGREEAEEQRRQLVEQWESQVDQVESKLRNVVDEKMGLVSREREIGTMVEQWKRTADERSSVIERLRESEKRKGEELERRSKELHLLREEAERRGQEVQRQREEMSSMVNKWRMEMEGIQASHIKERKELEEVTAKYHQLKSKVRRYQKHVDAKEEHYKAEYARLEKEFRNTLEKLRERMEAAYSVKEQQVENELGNMREQLSTELRKVVSRSQGEQDLVAKREVGDYMEQLSNRVEQRLAELDQRFDQPVKLSSMDGGHQHGDSEGRRRM